MHFLIRRYGTVRPNGVILIYVCTVELMLLVQQYRHSNVPESH